MNSLELPLVLRLFFRYWNYMLSELSHHQHRVIVTDQLEHSNIGQVKDLAHLPSNLFLIFEGICVETHICFVVQI